jgi:hypothetical protein
VVAAIAPGSAEELARFAELQARLPELIRTVFSDRLSPRTVVVVPGLSVDAEQLARIPGALHYEERQLSMLLLLRLPNTRLIYLTSQPIHPLVIDYYLNMLQGIPTSHARRRLTLISTYDGALASLTRKVLDRPRLLHRLQESIGDPARAHLSVFNSSPLERTLAVALDVPLYACDPALMHLGGKTGARRIFRDAGVLCPDGAEGLRDPRDVAAALAALKRRNPSLRRAVVKLDEGFSGEGNACFDYQAVEGAASLERSIERRLPELLDFEAQGEHWEHYCARLREMQGIVEAWIDGGDKQSPSVQFRINPLGEIESLSTHDQVLGGPSGQVFLGSTFPARPEYRRLIQAEGLKVAEQLRERGVIGRFAVDFVVTRSGDDWTAYAIEINLRKGGTTHPFQMLQFLTNGFYDPEDGVFRTQDGQPRFYYASDNLRKDAYRRLTPDDVIEVSVEQGLHFDASTQQGVAFSLLGCVSEHGKLGLTAIGNSPAKSQELFDRAVGALDEAAG